jgi:SnoaL-like domain
MPSGAIVRTPLRARPTSRRTFAQRLALRFPAVATAYTRMLARLKLGSRLRRELMRRFFQDGVEAFNRRDFDVLLLGVDPDREVYPPPEIVEAGFAESRYQGRAGYYDWVRTWADVWGKDVRLEPLELIDLGDRTVLLGEARALGQGSGVGLSWEWGSVSTLRDGRPVRDDVFNDHGQALSAAGLSA